MEARKLSLNELTPLCPHCQCWSKKTTGDDVYPHRPDLHHKTFYICKPCDAYVGCHPGTDTPLGTLANSRLRRARNRAHKAFDPLWRKAENPRQARKALYAKLAKLFRIRPDESHIGQFNEKQCFQLMNIIDSGELDNAHP